MQPPIRLWACSCWEQASFLAMGAWGIGGAIGAVVGGRGTHTVTIPHSDGIDVLYRLQTSHFVH